MAIYNNFNQINEYMKLGSGKDSCWICAKKITLSKANDAYEAMRGLEGKVENQKVIVIRRSGIDTCICMECIKTVYDEHIKPTIVIDEDLTADTNKKEEPEIKDTKKKK